MSSILSSFYKYIFFKCYDLVFKALFPPKQLPSVGLLIAFWLEMKKTINVRDIFFCFSKNYSKFKPLASANIWRSIFLCSGLTVFRIPSAVLTKRLAILADVTGRGLIENHSIKMLAIFKKSICKIYDSLKRLKCRGYPPGTVS